MIPYNSVSINTSPTYFCFSASCVTVETRERLTSDASLELNCNGCMLSSQTQPEEDDQGDQRNGQLLQEDHHNANTGPEDTAQSMYEYCNGAESPKLDQACYSNGTSGREQPEEGELPSGEQDQQKTRTRAREQNKDKLKNGP